MAYSRWSNSEWYVWADVDGTLRICPSNKIKQNDGYYSLTKEESLELYEALKMAIEDPWWSV